MAYAASQTPVIVIIAEQDVVSKFKFLLIIALAEIAIVHIENARYVNNWRGITPESNMLSEDENTAT